jgi:hypothetical protein
MRLSPPGDSIGGHSRPRNLLWVARQSLKLQPDQADPYRALLIGEDEFPFPDSRPMAGRELLGWVKFPAPRNQGLARSTPSRAVNDVEALFQYTPPPRSIISDSPGCSPKPGPGRHAGAKGYPTKANVPAAAFTGC